MKRRYTFAFHRLAVVILAAVVLAQFSLVPSPALAQDGYSRYNIFRQLFGPYVREPYQLREQPRRLEERRPRRLQERPRRQAETRRGAERRKSQSGRSVARRREPAADTVIAAPVEKLQDARVVLVVGDFLASGLAESLAAVFEQSSGVRVVDRTNGSSGFVRDDFYNWPAEIGPLLEAEKPAAVVVMIGSNDRQQIKTEGKSEPVRSATWIGEYEARIAAFTTAISEKKVPLVWVGMPPFKSNNLSSDMLAFNDIYRRAAEKAGGTFVDIWDGFVDENGSFVTTGPDINGQPVKLRGSDGINMTRAGKRKLAFYVEKPLNRILGDSTTPGVAEPGAETPPGSGTAAAGPSVIDRTQPISLSDPQLDGGTELLGASLQARRNGTSSAADRLAVDGIAPAPKPGRVDDFTWSGSGPDN